MKYAMLNWDCGFPRTVDEDGYLGQGRGGCGDDLAYVPDRVNLIGVGTRK